MSPEGHKEILRSELASQAAILYRKRKSRGGSTIVVSKAPGFGVWLTLRSLPPHVNSTPELLLLPTLISVIAL